MGTLAGHGDPGEAHRLDWRFLLPELNPAAGRRERALVLGGRPGLADLAFNLGLASEVFDRLDLGAADVVAVLDGSHPRPSEVARALRAGGLAYWEVSRARPPYRFQSPARMCRALRAEGLEPTAVYACLPNFERCRHFLPLDEAGPFPWFFSTLYSASSPRRRLLAVAARLWMRRDGRRLAGLVPRYAVIASRAERPDDPRPAAVSGMKIPNDVARPGDRCAALAVGGDRVVLLPWPPGGSAPRSVVKVPKVEGVRGRSEEEHLRLRELQSKLPESLRSSVPVPRAHVQLEGMTVVAESYLPGASVQVSTEAWGRSWRRRVRDLESAAGWIVAFHRDVQVVRKPWGAPESATWIEAAMADFESAFGMNREEEALFSGWRKAARGLDGLEFPTVIQHRDFNIWNVVQSNGIVGVVDWEGARAGLPLVDLLHFSVHWHEAALHLFDGAAQLRGFDALVFGGGSRRTRRAAIAIARVVSGYLSELRLDPRFVPVLLVHLWVELALRRRRQQLDLGETPGDPRRANRNFSYVALLAKRAETLFARSPAEGGLLAGLRG